MSEVKSREGRKFFLFPRESNVLCKKFRPGFPVHTQNVHELFKNSYALIKTEENCFSSIRSRFLLR